MCTFWQPRVLTLRGVGAGYAHNGQDTHWLHANGVRHAKQSVSSVASRVCVLDVLYDIDSTLEVPLDFQDRSECILRIKPCFAIFICTNRYFIDAINNS
jgi:hypothetical protein